MTENSEKVIEFLKRNYGKEFTKQEIAETLGISLPSVTGSIRGLIRKGEVNGVEYITERTEVVEVEPATETRKAKEKVIRYESLTEAGLAFDPVQDEIDKKAAKAKAKQKKVNAEEDF